MKPYATFQQRLLAAFIDNALSSTFLLIPVIFYRLNDRNLTFVTGSISLLLIMAWPVFTLYNTVYLVSARGASIGKKIAGITIVDKRSSKPLGFWRAYLRQTSKKISWFIFGAGYLWMLLDEHKQTWHDKIARSTVYAVRETPITSSQHKNKKSSFLERHINFFAALSIIFMLLTLFILLHICIKVVPLYKQAFTYISLSQFTILALNIGILIKKMRLFFIWISPLSLLIFALPKDKKLSLFLGITIGLVFLLTLLSIRFGIYHPHFMML